MDRPPIKQVLEHYGADFSTARSQGAELNLLCPFHDDSHPSGYLNESKGVYFCQVCGMGGDSWELIKQQEGVNFTEAKRFAKTQFGFEGGNVQRPVARRKQYRPSWT